MTAHSGIHLLHSRWGEIVMTQMLSCLHGLGCALDAVHARHRLLIIYFLKTFAFDVR